MRSMSRFLEEGEKALPGHFKDTYKILLLAIIFLFLPNMEVRSQENENIEEGDTVGNVYEFELDPVVVIGDEAISEREVENPSKFMTVIDVSESTDRKETVSEVLSETVGVQVNSWSGPGGMSSMSIRGSSSSQVEVYLDGVPLNRAVTGVTNLEDLPLDNVQYIEVFRGGGPADFASAGIGGVVNLVTRKDMEGGLVSATYGSWDTYEASAMGAGPAGPANVLAFFGYRRSESDFEYDNDNGTPLNGSDDFTENRKNNDFESYDLTVRSTGQAGKWRVTVVATGHKKEQGLPGIQSVQAEETRLSTMRTVASGSVRNRDLFSGKLDLALGMDGLWENQILDDPEGELGTGGTRETANVMNTYGGHVKASWRINLDAVLTGYAELRKETYRPIEYEPDTFEGDLQERTQLTGVISAELTDETGKWTLLPALRHERYYNEIEGEGNFAWSSAGGDNNDTLDLTSPSVGVLYRWSEGLVLKANAGRFYRVPTFYELFGDRGVAVGNTDLEPEKSLNWDAGFVYKSPGKGPISKAYLEYAFFKNRVDDLIIFFQNSQRTIRAMNIGGALIAGHELAFGVTLFDDWRLSGNYTFQSAVDKGDVPYWQGNALPLRPMHEAYARLGWSHWERLSAWVDGNYVSGNYWDRANIYEVDDRRIYNAGVTAMVYKAEKVDASVTVEGKNLSDDRVADIAGYPLPGRSGYVTLQVRWR